MVEAQRQGVSNLQLRFLLDFVAGASGLVTIDDGPIGLTVEVPIGEAGGVAEAAGTAGAMLGGLS